MIITSWSEKGYKEYGHRFEKTCPETFVAVTDEHLEADPEYLSFMKRYAADPAANGIVDGQKNYRFDAVKFAKKVFALTSVQDDEWLIWIDGDVEFTGPLDPVLKEVLRGDIAYLGRKDWDHSECGFVAYRVSNPRVREFLAEFRRMYSSGDVFKEREWHDSWIFDVLRGRFDLDYFNISEGVPGNHVWPETVLAKAMVHNKGPELKAKAYGKNKIKTVNCVPDRNIQANIKYSTSFFDRWLKVCKPHDLTAVVCSAGPSLKENIDEIRRLKRKKNVRIVCVKHSHDVLIENGIIPWACVLLDPRSHVQDFIENPHPKVNYISSSMVHPTTVDRLIEKDSSVIAYHAAVNAGEDKLIEGIMIGGGSAAAWRGLHVLHAMGFRKFELFGYDACFREVPDTDRLLTVTIENQEYITTAELLAQKQDLEAFVQVNAPSLKIHGDGMLAHVHSIIERDKADFAHEYG